MTAVVRRGSVWVDGVDVSLTARPGDPHWAAIEHIRLTRFFRSATGPRGGKRRSHMRADELVDYIFEHPGLSATQLAAATGVNVASLSSYLRKEWQAGRLSREVPEPSPRPAALLANCREHRDCVEHPEIGRACLASRAR